MDTPKATVSDRLLTRIKLNEGNAGISPTPLGDSEWGAYLGVAPCSSMSPIYQQAGVTPELAGGWYCKEIVIGYGHSLQGKKLYKYYTNPRFREKVNNLSEETADKLLQLDVELYTKEAFKLTAQQKVSWKGLTNLQKETIIELTFQLGAPRFKKFKDFWKCMRQKDYFCAAKELKNSNLYKQTPERVKLYEININPINQATDYQPPSIEEPILGATLVWIIGGRSIWRTLGLG